MQGFRPWLGAVFVLGAGVLFSVAWAGVCEGMNGGPGDLDGDGFVQAIDCDDADPGTWLPPNPVRNLRFESLPDTFVWDAPADPGTNSENASLSSDTASTALSEFPAWKSAISPLVLLLP